MFAQESVMDIQKEREAFKAWFKKEYLGIDNLANQGDEGAITRRDYAYVGWQAAKAQAVPEGFVLMPKEPTPKMIDATWDFDDEIREMSHNTRNEFIYKTMIEAQEQK